MQFLPPAIFAPSIDFDWPRTEHRMLFDPIAMSGASCNSLGAVVISIDVELPSQITIRFVGPNAIPAGIEQRICGYSFGAGTIYIDAELLAFPKPNRTSGKSCPASEAKHWDLIVKGERVPRRFGSSLGAIWKAFGKHVGNN